MSSLRPTVVVTALLVAGLTGCGSGAHPSSNTLIARSRSIGPISLGETKATIEAAYGKGRGAALPGRPHPTPLTFYPPVSIGVLYYRNHAVYIETTAPRYRTKSGLGVGSTVAQLKKDGAECDPGPYPQLCGLVDRNLATSFFMTDSAFHSHTRVVRVVVGPLGS